MAIAYQQSETALPGKDWQGLDCGWLSTSRTQKPLDPKFNVTQLHVTSDHYQIGNGRRLEAEPSAWGLVFLMSGLGSIATTVESEYAESVTCFP